MKCVAKSLQILGAIFAVLLLCASIYVIYVLAGNRTQTDTITKKEVAFLFAWGGLNGKQNFSVISSVRSQRSLTGDHLDRICLQLTDFKPVPASLALWLPADTLASHEAEAVELALNSGEECFGNSQSRPAGLFAYLETITLHTGKVTAYEALLYDPHSKRLLYVSEKT